MIRSLSLDFLVLGVVLSRGPTRDSSILGVRVVFLLRWFILSCLFFFLPCPLRYLYVLRVLVELLGSPANEMGMLGSLGP